MTELTVAVESELPVAVVKLSGPLNLVSGSGARTRLHKLLAECPSGVVVDIAELTVVDDLALTLFSAFATAAAQIAACPVALCAPSAGVSSALRRLVISRMAPTYPTRELALAAIGDAPAPRRYRQRLAAGPDSGSLARDVVAEACRAWGVLGLLEDARIVVTELVANGVRYAAGEMRLGVTLGQRYLHLSVWDGSVALPVRRAPSPAGGYGLVLVEALAASWGSRPAPDGKVVWATLRLPR